LILKNIILYDLHSKDSNAKPVEHAMTINSKIKVQALQTKIAIPKTHASHIVLDLALIQQSHIG